MRGINLLLIKHPILACLSKPGASLLGLYKI